MKSGRQLTWKEARSPHVAVLAAMPRSTLDIWNRSPGQTTSAAPLTAEEHIRMIELAAERQAHRRRVTPESDLRDWLDAEEEVKSH